MVKTIDKVRKKTATQIFGFSMSFLDHELIGMRKIKTYKLGKCVYVSIDEIEKLIERGSCG